MSPTEIVSCIKKSLDQLNVKLTDDEVENLLETPKTEAHGDIAFPCFILAKKLKQAPPKIAAELASKFSDELKDSIVESVQSVGPYVNFKLKTDQLALSLVPQILKDEFLQPEKSKNEKMMIEYSQPNTHKAFHVGHTRNVALGDALLRICQWGGFDVTPVNYIGDVGTHIAKCLWYFTKHYKGEVPEHNLGEFLGEMYIESDKLQDFKTLTRAPHPGVISAQIESIQPHPENENWQVVSINDGKQKHSVVCGGKGFAENDFVAYAPVGQRVSGRRVTVVDKMGTQSDGVLCSEKEISISSEKNKIFVFEKPVPLGEEVANLLALKNIQITEATVVAEIHSREKQVSDMLKALESGEKQITDLWEQTRTWSLDEFNENYKWLNARFDHVFYESEVADSGKSIVKKGLEDQIFIKSEGAIGAELKDFKLPFFLLLKSDGTSLYSTKDLSLAELKFNKYEVDRSIYVVDATQSLHFEQVFATLNLLGFKNANKCFHLGYGQVVNRDGSKMSSRVGNTILFSQLKNTLLEKINTDFLNKYKDDWSEDEINDTAHSIALATIKYGMLNQDSAKNILFDLDDWTSKTGNTGPYMMYAYARIQSMLRDSGLESQLDSADFSYLKEDAEHRLLMELSRFRKVINKSCDQYEPQLICIYMYELAKKFSSFYSQCPVIKTEDEKLKLARLALCKATAMTLKQCLLLIGVSTVERM